MADTQNVLLFLYDTSQTSPTVTSVQIANIIIKSLEIIERGMTSPCLTGKHLGDFLGC